MVPFQVLLIPLFIVTLKLGLVDSYAGVILPVAVNAFGIFLLRQAFTTIPTDLEDAARIDGCGPFTIYARIMMPLVKPALAAQAAFTFVAQWNDFLWPLVVLKSRELYTLQLGLASPPRRLRRQLALHFGGLNHRLGADGAVLSFHPAIFHAGC